jgi:PAS domain-containing protein
MQGIGCGLLGSPESALTQASLGRARDLTVSWLRWRYFGDILEDADLVTILRRARAAGDRYCLVQGYGHIVAEHAGPDGSHARNFFDVLDEWVEGRDFVFAGVPGRCLLVDLDAWSRNGEPSHAPVLAFGAELEAHLLDLGSDLSDGAGFLTFLDEMCEKAGRGVFVLNYESYEDVAEPPPGFAAPVSTLYCVAAGLKPNRILETHSFDKDSRVVFFDYSTHALEFRRRLDTDWDGRDYPSYLRGQFERHDGTHYYLWPGATADNMDWPELERLWATELTRWGGAEAFERHWRRYRTLRREYLLANILEPASLLARIEDAPGAVIWWSNAFCTIYSATHHSLEGKRLIYENWIAHLAEKAPGIFLYGSDHSNSSVNGITARDYRGRYHARGGDPLLSRAFHRRSISF